MSAAATTNENGSHCQRVNALWVVNPTFVIPGISGTLTPPQADYDRLSGFVATHARRSPADVSFVGSLRTC